MERTNMYPDARTWSPFKGCLFDCTYCAPTFKAQAKRQLHVCQTCYDYTPHEHPERLTKIPSAPIVFTCGNSDIAFARPAYVQRIINAIKGKNLRCPARTYYLQSKRPQCLAQHLGELPDNVVLVTTLETNRDEGYGKVSKAPPPSQRWDQFLSLDYPRKVITIEPALDFDVEPFAQMVIAVRPEYVWLGFNSRPAQVQLPEPSPAKMLELARLIKASGIPVKGKETRGITL